MNDPSNLQPSVEMTERLMRRVNELDDYAKRLEAENKRLKAENMQLQQRLEAGPPDEYTPPLASHVHRPAEQTPMEERQRTAIVIDDSNLMTKRLKHLLERNDLHVVATAHDGAFGADLVLTHKPAVVLLDYEMPVMNGLDCVKEIRKQDKIVKLIMVSGSNQIESPQALLQYGLDEVILKPVDESKLIKAIKRLGI